VESGTGILEHRNKLLVVINNIYLKVYGINDDDLNKVRIIKNVSIGAL